MIHISAQAPIIVAFGKIKKKRKKRKINFCQCAKQLA